MTQAEGEITYPGDPMCLYSALSVAVHRAVQDAGPLDSAQHYNDLAPRWTRFPNHAYRMSVGHDGFRAPTSDPNTDETVYDPRVWDEPEQDRWRALLRHTQPKVVLISSVSPAHRYALEIAKIAKELVPGVFVVLGGRHVDETTTCLPGNDLMMVAPSSTLAVMREDKVPHVVDAIISGEAYFSLDLLMRAIAEAVDLDSDRLEPQRVRSRLEELLAQNQNTVPGRSLITLMEADRAFAYPLQGPKLDLTALPSPYEAFAIRSRFPIFVGPETGGIRLTAHLMVSNACPYQCNFCSETAKLAGGLNRFRHTDAGLDRVLEYVGYGAQALFFDDSVFWSGTYRDIIEFSSSLSRLRRQAAEGPVHHAGHRLTTPAERIRLHDLEWGAQFTVDVLAALHSPQESREVLRAMREAGCTYIYIGIESMSEQVMDHVHKNLRRRPGRTWASKVREALALVKDEGLRVGTSVLFGLEGETRASIDETIDGVHDLIDDGLIDLASPNILTYHPATPITRQHGMAERLDYHSPNLDNRKPYIYFEEAFPGVVSQTLSEDDLWYIHTQTDLRWGTTRNDSTPVIPDQVSV
ncbi:MAG: B12-binding domain-containing radical SAM protein [Micrococcales bacterium]|nr:MAG: B12-binding domain-containing radical SAM protein [Micrococcales bacterium]